jgi:hypothetical protein
MRPSTLHALVLTVLTAAGCNDYELHGDDKIPSGDPTCGDWADTTAFTVAVDDSCLREPTVGSFSPIIEWQWDTNPINPGWDDIMSAPAIANLTDDDGDGDIDEDDIPDIVFTTFSGGNYQSAGMLNAISGDGSGTHWSLASSGGHAFHSSSSPAIGDLDGDGLPEVCVGGTSAAVVCLTMQIGADPVFRFAAGSEIRNYSCPSIADLDGDGMAEVISGREFVDASGTVFATGTGGSGQGSVGASIAVDWDGDGELEVATGNTIYRRDGSILMSTGGPDGIPAIGDFNMDGLPDLITSGNGTVTLTWNHGVQAWSTPTPGTGTGGAATVADFDADGFPEVGLADMAFYTVFDSNGSVLWSNPVQDLSSSVTGSSVFDFEGDGQAEVVYADEITLWIFDGATGAVLMQQEGHASGTLYEYPLIADVDRDGSTEIIVASNDYAFDGWNGITVIGDETESWAPARPIWNQFAYHITNVNNDGSIPTIQDHNWDSWNNFRAGGTELGPAHWQPDLAPLESEICDVMCSLQQVELTLEVANGGLLPATGVGVSFAQSGAPTSPVHLEVVTAMPAGGATVLGPLTLTRDEWGSGDLLVTVDPSNFVDECNESNNAANLGPWPCP